MKEVVSSDQSCLSIVAPGALEVSMKMILSQKPSLSRIGTEARAWEVSKYF